MQNEATLRNISTGALVAIALGTLGVLVLTGCKTVELPSPTVWEYSAQNTGQIVMINSELAYVVLETVVAPEPGQTVDVKRKGRTVGALFVTDRNEAPYVIADIVKGNLRVGDAVLLRPKGMGEQP